MFGNQIAALMEEWHRQHGGSHDDPEWQAYLDDMQENIGEKWGELQQEHSNEGLFGMSSAGGCTRKSGLKKLGHTETFTGSTRMTFFIGHVVELMAVSTLRAIGLDAVGGQDPVVIPGIMHSYADSLIVGGMPDMTDMIELQDHEIIPVSVKSAGYKKSGKERRGKTTQWVRRGFPELPFQGVRASQPGHWAQMQAEMHGKRAEGYHVTRSLYLVVAKDIVKAMEQDPYLGDGGNGSLTFYTEWVPYDYTFCVTELEPTWSNQLNAVNGGHPGQALVLPTYSNVYQKLAVADDKNWQPNAGTLGTYNPCMYCDLIEACKSYA